MISFKDRVLLITGGTGSFGHAVLDRFLTTDIREIRILSRDEKKQDDMRHAYQLACPACAEKIKFYIGDVRDYRSIAPAFRGVDYVFHAAALKQVPSCEFFPMEAVKTNVIGSNNVIDACVENRVKKAIFLSTDKAAYPINAMGMSKAVMEKNVIARSKQMLADDPVLCLTRYGNVMASRGSVVVPDLEITTVATFLSATRSISSAMYSSERLLPAKTTSGASFAPPSCLAKLWESASMAQRAPR